MHSSLKHQTGIHMKMKYLNRSYAGLTFDHFRYSTENELCLFLHTIRMIFLTL